MQQNPASPRTRNRARLPQALFLFLIFTLACNLPWAGGSSPQAQPAELVSGPAVNIQEPTPGASMTVGETFDFLATATDEAGVVQLDLFVDGTAVLSQSSPDANGLTTLSLMYPMVATTPGSYALIARAYNSKGEMRDSVVHYVTVGEANASTQEYAQYVVQEGDTLENIAQRLGISVDSILQANPHLSAGQVLDPGQVILIPMGPQPPAQAAVPAPGGGAQPVGQPVNQPGGGQPGGNQPGNNQPGGNPPIGPLGQPVPGIVPVFLPQPGQAPAVPIGVLPMPPPVLFPVGGNPSAGLQAPTDVKATVNGCQVSLTWKDNASDEAGYDVYRANPGMPAVSRIAQLPAGSAAYQETLNTFGKIMYQVAASKTEGGKILRAHSATIYMDVPASANCSSGPKQVVIQPVSFQPADASLGFGFVNVTIGSFSSIRIPRGQQTSQKTGDWSAATLGWTVPMPELANMKPGDQLTLEVQGNGVAGNAPPVALGQVIVAHTYEDLTAPDSKSKIWEAKNGQMTLTYRIWLEGWKWGGGSSAVQMPVPYDLQLGDSGGNRVLTWKYDAPQNLADGFIVYSTYTCGSATTESAATAGKTPLSMNFPKDKEPVGCTCSFRVSAFGLFGESKQSEPQSGDCKTTAPEETMQIIFENLEIKSLAQPTSADISISANEGSVRTRKFLFPMTGVYPLGQMVVRGGNRLILNFPAGQRRSIQFTFSVANLCHGGMVLQSNDDSTWKILEQGYSMAIESLDKNCVLNLSLKSASSAAPLLKADQEGCTTSAECQSGNCQEGYCAPAKRGAYGASCFANSQCTSGLCQCLAPDGANIPCPPLSVSPPLPGYCVGLGSEGYGQACERASDCASFSCVNGACVPQNGLGQPRDYCNNDSQCASNFCLCTAGYDGKNCKPAPNSLDPAPGYCIVDQSAAKNGADCQRNDECQSNYCADGKICAPRDGTGLAGEYCHHNNQCFSGSCNCPSGTDIFGFCINWEIASNIRGTCNP